MRRGSLRAGLSLALAGAGLACARETRPEEFFQLSEESPRNRAMQTRRFETSDETEILSASAAVLQDLGFQIEETAREAGFLRATKERSAREYGQEIGRFLALLLLSLSGKVYLFPVDLHQKIAATLVARPVNADATLHEVRILFYRVIWQGEGQSGDTYIPPGAYALERIRDPEIYQEFFAKLSKSLFLEAFTL